MNIEQAIQLAISGKVLIFAGAGFSAGAKNQKGQDFKRANDLCELLCEELAIEKDDDLQYVSEKYISKKKPESLIKTLQQEYIASKVSEAHEILMGIRWRRVYTTNYDDIIEKASDAVGCFRVPVTLGRKPSSVDKSNVIVHMNGYIKDVSPEKLFNEFKLSRVSYLNDDFLKSEWLTLFKHDIDNAKAVFFIGYSLRYDIDIQRMLIQSDTLEKKCFFITKPGIKQKDKDILSKFGKISDIGIEEFANKVAKAKAEFVEIDDADCSYNSFDYINNSNFNMKNIVDKDIFDSFLCWTN